MPASHIALQLPRTIFLMAFPQICYTHNNPKVTQRSECVKEMNTQTALLLHGVTITLFRFPSVSKPEFGAPVTNTVDAPVSFPFSSLIQFTTTNQHSEALIRT